MNSKFGLIVIFEPKNNVDINKCMYYCNNHTCIGIFITEIQETTDFFF